MIGMASICIMMSEELLHMNLSTALASYVDPNCHATGTVRGFTTMSLTVPSDITEVEHKSMNESII